LAGNGSDRLGDRENRTSDYGYAVEVAEGYDEAVVRARMAMRGEGFSIITEAHVGDMLGPDAGTGRQYLIMGVFGTTVQEKRVAEDLQMAVHLPCNVVVQESGSSAIVAALDPGEGVEEAGAATPEVVDAARDALSRALLKIENPLGDEGGEGKARE
jgi:uncharacterized protein (DUF302 family)